MRVYLAGPFSCRAMMPDIAAEFEAAGFEVSERWWMHDNIPLGEGDNPDLETQAIRDFEAVVNADALIVYNFELSEGKAVEMGIALAMCTPVVSVGRRSNIFHYLAGVTRVGSTDEAIEVLMRTGGR